MDAKYFDEIKAREQAAMPGEWKAGGCPRRIRQDLKSVYIGIDSYDGQMDICRDATPADVDFIAHARTDIPELIVEVERLTKENQGLRANSMIQEQIISGQRDPLRDGEIARLIMASTVKDQQITMLKKALKTACDEIARRSVSHVTDIPKESAKIQNDFIRQAQEQEGKK